MNLKITKTFFFSPPKVNPKISVQIYCSGKYVKQDKAAYLSFHQLTSSTVSSYCFAKQRKNDDWYFCVLVFVQIMILVVWRA